MEKSKGRKVLHDGFLSKQLDIESGHEVVQVSDSIAILIHIVASGEVILTRQSRPAMKGLTDDDGVLVEVPAGRFDRDLSVRALAVAEVKEEVGVTIVESDVVVLNGGEPLALSPGAITERIYLAYVAINKEQMEKGDRVFGLAEEGEKIKRLFLSLDNFIAGPHQDMKTWALARYLENVTTSTP